MKNTKKITGILVDVHNGVAQKATIEKSLDSYYKALNCDCIDIVSRRIDGQLFDIICDDEALLKVNPRPSAMHTDGHVALCGNLFIVNNDCEGDVCSIREGQADHVIRNVKTLYTRRGEHWPCLTKVTY